MPCPSCGDQSSDKFCPACGAEIHAEEHAKPSGGIGAGGAVVLMILLLVGTFFLLASNPQLPEWLRLPSWLSARNLNVAPLPGTPVIVTPATAIPLPPAAPYEELSSTRLSLSDYTEQEVRIRLATERTVADVDPLLRSRAKDLRQEADVVRIRVYAPGSDATSSDASIALYVAVDLGSTHLPPEELAGMTEVEPGIFRTTE